MEPSEHLRQVPLFSNLSSGNLQRVAEIAGEQRFPRHSHLFSAGQRGRALYFILSGEGVVRAVVGRRRQRPVAYLHPGDCVGLTSLLLGEPHDATVEATTDVTALVIQKADFDRLRRSAPGLDTELILPEEMTAKLRRGTLPWLQAGEVLVFLGRRHWLVLVRALLLPTLAALLAGLLILAFLGSSWPVPLAILFAIYLAVLAWRVVDWRNDYLAVTTQRVVRRELVLLTYESRHEIPLNRIQDVLVERNVPGNLLGYGQVSIHTAAQSGLGQIVFDHLPEPDMAKNIIFQQIYRAEAQSQQQAGEAARGELKRRLGWATPEEIAAEGEARGVPRNGQQAEPARRGWRARMPRFRLLPALRLEEDTRITWRKHWVFLLRRIALPLVAAFLWFLAAIASATGNLPFLPALSLGAVLGLFVASLPIAFWLWWQTVDWENDVYILTDDRIIDVEKKPLFFAEERREATLDRIQNVNLTIPSPVAAMLHYGDVDIETAGLEGKFTFTHVVQPHEVQREIMSRVAHFRERQQQIASLQRRKEIADWLATYESLRREREKRPPAGP